MRYILIDLGLFKYVKSMVSPLADDESAIKIWNEKDHKALSTISLHCKAQNIFRPKNKQIL